MSEFEEWLTKGAGEALFGSIIKSAASREKNRLQRRLEVPNLFPHLEHEDRATIEKLDQTWERGDRMVKRCKARTKAIDGLLSADAGLRITAEDLRAPGLDDFDREFGG